MNQPSVAVLIPCYNEEAAIGDVVSGFRAALPEAVVYVYDNNSRDGTAEAARRAGAVVRNEPRQGKGNVIRRMFADIEADIYVLVDGDATYDAPSAPRMVQRLREDNLDMVVGRRIHTDDSAYRAGHQFGNRLLTGTVGRIFGRALDDILSGYRVFSRRFVKSFPAFAEGFQSETEFTIHALELKLPVAEIDTPYYARPLGSDSKLNTWADGFRILALILRLWALEQPFRFFGLLALLCWALASALFAPVLIEYLDTGLVPRLPTLVVAVGGYAFGLLNLVLGIILHTTTTGRLEVKRMAYLAMSPGRRPGEPQA